MSTAIFLILTAIDGPAGDDPWKPAANATANTFEDGEYATTSM
jgi:hypothetical protein